MYFVLKIINCCVISCMDLMNNCLVILFNQDEDFCYGFVFGFFSYGFVWMDLCY